MAFVIKRNFSGKADQHHESMLNYLKNFLPLLAVDFDKNGPIISVKPENLLFVLKSLKLHTNTQFCTVHTNILFWVLRLFISSK